jgi:hypothetical protein
LAGRLRDDFNVFIVNFPFICSNIPAAPAYRVYLSQLIRYSKACGSYQDSIEEKSLYEVCLIRIKEQVGEKKSKVCTHKYSECILKNTSNKYNKYVVNEHSSMLMISVSENFLVESGWFLYKIRSVPS